MQDEGRHMQTSEAPMRQQLEELKSEQEQLRMMSALVDSHVQEIAMAIQRKRTHTANIACFAQDIALAKQGHEVLNEHLSGADYSRLIAHIENYQTRLSNRKHHVAARIAELQQQLATN